MCLLSLVFNYSFKLSTRVLSLYYYQIFYYLWLIINNQVHFVVLSVLLLIADEESIISPCRKCSRHTINMRIYVLRIKDGKTVVPDIYNSAGCVAQCLLSLKVEYT